MPCGRAGGWVSKDGVIVSPARRATGLASLDVAVHLILVNVAAVGLFEFQRPAFLRAVDLLQILDACILLRGSAGFDEVRYGNRGKQTNDRDHDHDFNQRKTATTIYIPTHTVRVFKLFKFAQSKERASLTCARFKSSPVTTSGHTRLYIFPHLSYDSAA